MIADRFAGESNAYLAERQDFIYQERLSTSFDRLTALEQEPINLTGQASSSEANPVLAAQQSAISRQYSAAFEQNELLAATPPVLGDIKADRGHYNDARQPRDRHPSAQPDLCVTAKPEFESVE